MKTQVILNFINFIIYFQAEEILRNKDLDKEYSPISGNPDFCTNSINLALGDDNEIVPNKMVIFNVLNYYRD